MIFKNLLKLITFFFFIFHCNISLSKDTIFYLDMNFLMNNSLAGKSIIKQIDKLNKTAEKSFKKSEEKIKDQEKQLISQKNILNEEEYLKNRQSFAKKVSDYKIERNNEINKISKVQFQAQKKLIDTLTSVLAEYSEKNSISYIIPQKNIIIGKTELNLTSAILKILDTKIKNIEIE